MSYRSTLWGLLSSTVGLGYWSSNKIPAPPPPPQKTGDDKKEQDPLEGWTWLLSNAEEALMKADAKQLSTSKAELTKELDAMKKIMPSIQFRKRFIEVVNDKFDSLDEETRTSLLESRLDASKRDKLLRDSIRKTNDSWLQKLLECFFSGTNTEWSDVKREVFIGRWKEQPYKRNLCGEMVSLAWKASHSAYEKGLTGTILGDVLWTIHLCISKELQYHLLMPLTIMHYELIFNMVMDVYPIVVELWNQTAVNSGTIAQREGKLPAVWEQERQAELQRIADLKKEGQLLKYKDGPVDELWRRHQQSLIESKPLPAVLDHSVISKDSFEIRRSMLQNSLVIQKPNMVQKKPVVKK